MADPDYRNLITFVRAGKESVEKSSKTEISVESSLTGDDAKSFYESVIKNEGYEVNNQKSPRNRKIQESSTNSVRQSVVRCESLGKKDSLSTSKKLNSKETIYIDQCPKIKENKEASSCYRTLRSSDTHKLQQSYGNELLKFAEHGNMNELLKLIKRGTDINYADAYGWTALMCSSMAGHADVIEYLLKHGADRNIVNNQGKTALDLAKDVGAMQVIDLFEQSDRRLMKKKSDKKKTRRVYCEICKYEYTESDDKYKSHLSSTVHLFNMKLKPKPDPFLISETNVGYKMMRKSGWDGEKGLGPEGKGHRYPIRTTLKRDRSCLGSEESKSKAKITHYGPNDTKAVKSYQKNPQRIISAKTVSKREHLRKERRAKAWERNLRCEMNMD